MLRVSLGRTLVLLAAVAAIPALASRTHRAPTSGHTHASFGHRARHAVAKKVNKIRTAAPARNTERTASTAPAETGTLGSVHSITQ